MPAATSLIKNKGIKKRNLLAFLALFILFGIYLIYRSLAAPTCTTTLNSGASISQALSSASSGSTICLNAGTYSYSAGTINKSTTTTVTAASGVDKSAIIVSSVIDVQTSNNLTFDSITFSGGGQLGTGSAPATNISIKNSSFKKGLCINQPTGATNLNINVESSDFTEIGQGGCSNEGRLTVNGRNTNKPSVTSANSGITIKNSQFNNTQAGLISGANCTDGIQLTAGASGVNIINNTFFGLIEGQCAASQPNNQGPHVDAIQLYDAKNARIEGNYVYGNSTGLVVYDHNGSPMDVINNVFVKGPEGHQALEVSGTGDKFDHNTIIGTAIIGLWNGNQSSNETITNNVITGGISYNGGSSSGFVISNNLTSTPTFKSSTPSKHDDYVLTAPTAALTGATDGSAIGIYSINSSEGQQSQANIWVASNGNDSGSNCKRFATAAANPDSSGASLCKSFSAALALASNGDSVRVLPGSYTSQSLTRTGLTRDSNFDNNIQFISDGGPGAATLSGLSIGSSTANTYGGINFDGFHVTGGPAIQEAKDVRLSNIEANNQTYISNSQEIKLEKYTIQPNGYPSVTSAPFSNGWGIGIVQQSSGSISAPSNITLDGINMHGVRATKSADHPDGVFMWRGGGVSTSQKWTGIKVRNSLFYNNECINWRYNDANPAEVEFENNFFDNSVNGISGCGSYSISVASATGTYKNNTIRGGVQVTEGDCDPNCGAVRTWKNNIILGVWSDYGCSNLSNDIWSKNIRDVDKCGASDITASESAIKFAGGSTYPDKFFLTSSGAATNTGDSSSGSYTSADYLGTTRPQGAGVDIGAHEYKAGGPPTCSTKQGDTNNDNAVDIFDLSRLLSKYGQQTTDCADIDRNGSVDATDLSMLLTRYGT